MRLAPDSNAWPVPGPAPLATARSAGFWLGGSSAAMRITSSAPGMSKSTISVAHRPDMTNSSASCPERQLTNSIPRSWSVNPRVWRDRLSSHSTAADWLMSYKVRAGTYPVNVTAVIEKMVTEALFEPLRPEGRGFLDYA